MADAMEWYAADNLGLSACYAPPATMESPFPNKAVYARVVGIPGTVVWTVVWEPLSSGGFSPMTYAGGPLEAGQVPTSEGAGTPSTYSPSDPNALAVVGFYELGIIRLTATAGGTPVPGELRMTIMTSTSDYPNLALAYEDGGPPPEELFWTQHQATYEVP